MAHLPPDDAPTEKVTPGQFGLWGKEEKRDWPLIASEEARVALSAFGLPINARIDWHSERPFSAVARLATEDGQIRFLKRHHYALRDADALETEHRFIAHLAARGHGVALPLSTKDGRTAFVRGEWCYECFPRLNGKDLYRDTMSWEPYRSSAHALEAGRALAAFHEASLGWEAPTRAEKPLVSSLSPFLHTDGPAIGLSEWIEGQPSLLNAIIRYGGLARLIDLVAPLLENARHILANVTPHWGHGDWHGSNLVWRREQGIDTVHAPFDFSMADRTSRHFDIAVALERSMIDWLHPISPPDHGPPVATSSAYHERRTSPDTTSSVTCLKPGRGVEYHVQHEHIDAFLQGYGSVYALKQADNAAIAAMLPLAHITFACSEIWYYDTLVNAPDLACATWETYLQDHSLWFVHGHGGALCTSVASRGGVGR